MDHSIHVIASRRMFLHLVRNNRFFLFGLVLKLTLSFFFASTYLSDLFIPFVKTAVHGNFWNIYKEYLHINPIAFPYPPVMLYIMALPSYLVSLISTGSATVSSLDIFLARIPLLVADVAITLVLIKWLRNTSNVVKWYWLNPVVIYISYIHGQLDIIPTAFLCLSLYCLFLDKLWPFMIFLALACATKFHVVITIPLLLIYLIKTKKISIVNLLKGVAVFIGLLFLLNLPFILQPEYIQMVYQNEEQGKVFASTLSIFNQYQVILIPACYMIMLYLVISFNFINRDVLLIFLALSFGMITFFIVPGQGWYMWNMPFLVYFMIRFQFKASNTFVILNVAYFLFFIIFPKSDFPLVAQFINPQLRESDNAYAFLSNYGIHVDLLMQLAFTFLQTALLLVCVSIFRIGVLKIRGYKIYHHPYLIGICGDSGTGKSTLSASIQDLFGKTNTLVVHGDDMHRWERGHQKWNEITHLNPQANWLHRDLAQLIDLKAGKKIFRQHYDHDTGKFTKKRLVKSNKIIIYEGLHSFYLKGASKIYDLKIFLKPSEALRRYWKVKRDTQTRGYSSEKVIEAIEKRMGDSLSHILNQEVDSDIIFSIENKQSINLNEIGDDNLGCMTNLQSMVSFSESEPAMIGQSEEIFYGQPIKKIKKSSQLSYTNDLDMILKITCPNDIYFEQLLDILRLKTKLFITHSIDHLKQEITISGEVKAARISEAALCLGLDIEDLTGTNPIWADDYLGLMQILLLYQISTQLKRNGMFLKTDVL